MAATATLKRPRIAAGAHRTIEQVDLAAALTLAVPLTRRATMLPVLKTVRWSGDRIVTTDLDAWVEVFLNGGEPGAALCLPATPLFELAQRLPRGGVDVSWTESEAVVTAGRERFRLRGMSATEFPLTPDVSGRPFALPSGSLRSALAAVRYAINTNEQYRAARPSLVGVHLVTRDGGVVVEATDGHRAAQVRLDISPAGDFSVTLPPGSVDRLTGLLDADDDGNVHVTIGDQIAAIETTGAWRFTTRLVGEPFPDLESRVPRTRDDLHLECRRSAWLDALARARAFTPELNRLVEVRCEQGTATLSATEGDTGDAVAMVEYTAAPHEPKEVAVNGDHLRDALRHLASDTVTLRVAGPRDVVLIKDGASLALLVPLRKLG